VTPESAAGAPVGGSPAVRKRDSSCCAAAVATSLGANECPAGPATASPRSARRRSSFLALALAFHARLYAELYARAQTTFFSLVIPAWAGGRPSAMISTGGRYRQGALDKVDYSAAAPTESEGTGAHPKCSAMFSALHLFTYHTNTPFLPRVARPIGLLDASEPMKACQTARCQTTCVYWGTVQRLHRSSDASS